MYLNESMSYFFYLQIQILDAELTCVELSYHGIHISYRSPQNPFQLDSSHFVRDGIKLHEAPFAHLVLLPS